MKWNGWGGLLALAVGALALGCGGATVPSTRAPKGVATSGSVAGHTTNTNRWLVTASGPDRDRVESVATDSAGNTIALIYDSGATDPLTLSKVNASGQLEWEKHFTGSLQYWNPNASSVKTDGAGNIYLLAASTCVSDACGQDGIDFGAGPTHGSTLVKFDSRGNLLWQHREADWAESLGVDSAGEAVLMRHIRADLSLEAETVVKIGADGSDLWTRQGVWDPAVVNIDSDGNVVVGTQAVIDGETTYPVLGERFALPGTVIAKLRTADGSTAWETQIGDDNDPVGGSPAGIGTSALGTVVVAGYFSGAFVFGADQFYDSGMKLLVFDATGTERFGTGLPYGNSVRMAVDPVGKVFLAENQGPTALVRWYDLAGDFLASTTLPADNSGEATVSSVAVLADHSAVVGGTFSGATVDFGTGQAVSGRDDAYLLGGLFRKQATQVEFSDDFDRTGALGSNWWTEDGQWATTGSAAEATDGSSGYAFWTGTPGADDTTSVTLSTPMNSTYVGVITRGISNDPARDHYAAYVGPDGIIHLARRNAWTYSYLADGPAFPSGSHVLSLTATGSNPVVLSVELDGQEIIHYSDGSGEAFGATGKVGMFDYEGSGQAIDAFVVESGSPSGGSGPGPGGGDSVVFSDAFSHDGSLGSNWWIADGQWLADGSSAEATGGTSGYAFWKGDPGADDTASVTLSTPLKSTYVGVIVRGASNTPDRDHYALYVAPDGTIDLARRNAWTYTYLVHGEPFPQGRHVLSLTAIGSDPVVLSVQLDGEEIIRWSDHSDEALDSAGKVGIFDYAGAGQPIELFDVTQP